MLYRIEIEIEVSDEEVVPEIMAALNIILPFMGDDVDTSIERR